MILVTKRQLIATVAERWRDAYTSRGQWIRTQAGFDPEAIYQQLAALPADSDEADVLALTGQPWWTQNICDECEQDREVTVGLGQEIHHETDTKYICAACLEQAERLASEG